MESVDTQGRTQGVELVDTQGRTQGKKAGLYERLKDYAASDFYPWHMPGHKRRLMEFVNPFSIDITEIAGFDDLHHPEGILKEAMEEAAAVYGSEKTWFLVNGSSCGILAAVCAAVRPGGRLLMARNCHKSAYHAALLGQLEVSYVYPELIEEGFYGELRPEAVEAGLKADPDIEAVIMVSPGYEGVVSDVEAIAQIVHRYGCTLIVDEAHGAHLPFGASLGFPESALSKGADIVIQSLHKTLPSLTQTALIHLGKESRISAQKLAFYLQIYQSSSPSYLLMASIDSCIRLMSGEKGQQLMQSYARNLLEVRSYLGRKLRRLRLYQPGEGERYDPSKLVIIADGNSGIDGGTLADMLRRCRHLEPEMNTDRYVILMSSPADQKEGFERLAQALIEIDEKLEAAALVSDDREQKNTIFAILPQKAPYAQMKPVSAAFTQGEWVPVSQAVKRICHDFVYIYPPGIPLLVPGEVLEESQRTVIEAWRDHGLEVHGIGGGDGKEAQIFVLPAGLQS
ncbi:MAG: aminotransferase class V-fold PLP-dependent enzyme [Lachnospiraceae bacterium]|nr:aminotransferase class V-fold PLP-dependent enzyme [Lachnospiraceae bacterium]